MDNYSNGISTALRFIQIELESKENYSLGEMFAKEVLDEDLPKKSRKEIRYYLILFNNYFFLGLCAHFIFVGFLPSFRRFFSHLEVQKWNNFPSFFT